MISNQFEDRWRLEMALARKALMKEGFLRPLYAVVGEDGTTTPIIPDFADNQTKEHSLKVVRLHALASNASAVFHRTEGWVRLGRSLDGHAPSQDDPRLEVVVLAAQVRLEGEVAHKFSVREIVRGKKGQPTSLREVRMPGPHGRMAGWMVENMLSPTEPSLSRRTSALAMLNQMHQTSQAAPASPQSGKVRRKPSARRTS